MDFICHRDSLRFDFHIIKARYFISADFFFSVIENKEQLDKVINKLVADKIYGSEFMIEPYLDGEKPYAVQKGKYI